jgi:hypothetical protein
MQASAEDRTAGKKGEKYRRSHRLLDRVISVMPILPRIARLNAHNRCMHRTSRSQTEPTSILSARLQDMFIVGGREMESKWKLEVTNQNSVASAGVESV